MTTQGILCQRGAVTRHSVSEGGCDKAFCVRGGLWPGIVYLRGAMITQGILCQRGCDKVFCQWGAVTQHSVSVSGSDKAFCVSGGL